MCTFNLTFNDAIIEKALPTMKSPQEIKEWMQQIVETALAQKIQTAIMEKNVPLEHDMSFFDCFDNGAWDDDPRPSDEIAAELHDTRVNDRPIIEPW